MEKIGNMSNKYEKVKEDRYSRFVYSLNQCGMFLLHSSDKMIETCLFEDFDIGARGDISDDNLEIFMYEGWIDENIKEKCIELRELFLKIHSEMPQLWNVQSVKTSPVWHDILTLSDSIKSMLYA